MAEITAIRVAAAICLLVAALWVLVEAWRLWRMR